MIRDVSRSVWPGERAVITIGAYDGVHLGHQAVISEVRRLADLLDAHSVVVTFDRHPAAVVRPESAPRLLTDLDQRLELLAATGVEATALIAFDEARAQERAEEFVHSVIVDCLGTRSIVVGEDFHFGKGRAGNVTLLRTLGTELGFTVEPMRLVSLPSADGPVSSTMIRRAVLAGDVEAAAGWLGRPYEMRGRVGHGDARGRQLGFPTANVEIPASMCLPADGVYAAWFVRGDGSQHPCAVNIGRRPTFYDFAETSLVEAHLLDFDGDLYDEHVAVRFVRRLRAERKFDGLASLVAQLEADVEETRRTLNVLIGQGHPAQ